MGALAGQQQLTEMKTLGIAARFNSCRSWKFCLVLRGYLRWNNKRSVQLPCDDLPGRWIKLSGFPGLDVYVCCCSLITQTAPLMQAAPALIGR